MTPEGTRRATPADRKAASAGLASAFARDPVFTWMSGTADCERRMAPFWRGVVRAGVRPDDHLLFVWRDGAGSALWRHVDRWKVTPGEMVRTVPAIVQALRLRLPVALRFLAAMEKAHPEAPHYYLEFIGTRRDQQGRGGGSALLAPMLGRCDDEGVGAYLESSNPRNVPFYARHGFEVTGAIRGPKGSPPLTPMWRDPR